MRKYSKITLVSGEQVPHTTIRGLKLAIQNKKQKEGTFICHCPSGNLHYWAFINDRVHVCAGTAKKKIRVGKGVNKPHYRAIFQTVKQS